MERRDYLAYESNLDLIWDEVLSEFYGGNLAEKCLTIVKENVVKYLGYFGRSVIEIVRTDITGSVKIKVRAFFLSCEDNAIDFFESRGFCVNVFYYGRSQYGYLEVQKPEHHFSFVSKRFPFFVKIYAENLSQALIRFREYVAKKKVGASSFYLIIGSLSEKYAFNYKKYKSAFIDGTSSIEDFVAYTEKTKSVKIDG